MTRPTVAVVVAQGEEEPPGLDQVRALADVRIVDDPAGLADVEVVFVWDFRTRLLRDAWPLEELRWVHAGSVGVDAIVHPALAESDVVVSNTRGVFERPIAEYVLTMLLGFAKDLPTTLSLQAQRRWVHRETETLCGRDAVILGAGALARAIARLLRAVGMKVTAVGRSARQGDPDFSTVLGVEQVDAILPDADAVIVALPLTAETHRFLDASRLARMRSGAWLVNVGRGGLIDEQALLDALRSGRIGGAALDVFDREPLPPEHDFWAMERVIVSPHMGGDRLGWREAVVDGFTENLRRWCEGEPLLELIDKQSFLASASPEAMG